LRGPSARLRVIIPRTETHQPRVVIVEAAGESEWLEAGGRVGQHAAKGVVVHPLCDLAVGSVDDEPWTAEMIANDTVTLAPFDQILGHVLARAIDEFADKVAGPVQFGKGAQRAFVQESLRQGTVDFSADSAIAAVHEILD